MKGKWSFSIILIAYYLLTVLPHETVGKFINSLFSALERSTYNITIAILFFFVIGMASAKLGPKVSGHAQRKKLLAYFLINIILSILCFTILFVLNIEAVHFIQYAIFAMLCFKVTKNLYRTLLISTLAGFFDELYQYQILNPHTSDYFDFNDVVVDLVGIGFGLLIIKTLSWDKINYKKIKNWFSLPELWILISLVLIFFVGKMSGNISVLQNYDDPTPFTLIKDLSENFWTVKNAPYAKFHILLPMEGLTLIILLWILYMPLCKNDYSTTKNLV